MRALEAKSGGPTQKKTGRIFLAGGERLLKSLSQSSESVSCPRMSFAAWLIRASGLSAQARMPVLPKKTGRIFFAGDELLLKSLNQSSESVSCPRMSFAAWLIRASGLSAQARMPVLPKKTGRIFFAGDELLLKSLNQSSESVSCPRMFFAALLIRASGLSAQARMPVLPKAAARRLWRAIKTCNRVRW